MLLGAPVGYEFESAIRGALGELVGSPIRGLIGITMGANLGYPLNN